MAMPLTELLSGESVSYRDKEPSKTMPLSSLRNLDIVEEPKTGFFEGLDIGIRESISKTKGGVGKILMMYGNFVRNSRPSILSNPLGTIPTGNSNEAIGARWANIGRKMLETNKIATEGKFKDREEGITKGNVGRDIGSGLTSIAASIGMGLTMGPGAAAVSFGASAAGEGFVESVESGKSVDESLPIATALGFAEGSIEAIGLDKFLKIEGGVVKRAVKGSLTEFLQEFSQSSAEGIIKTSTGVREYKGLDSFVDIAGQALYEGAIGAVLGGGASIALGSGSVSQVEDNLKKIGVPDKKAEEITKNIMQDAMDATTSFAEDITDKVYQSPESDAIYEEYHRIKQSENVFTQAKASASEAISHSVRALDETLGTISTRAANISEEFRDKLRQYEFNSIQALKEYESSVKGFQESFNKKNLGKKDFDTLDLALKNGDVRKIEEITSKYGMSESYKNVRDVLDSMPSKAEEVGIKMGFIKNYFPRSVKNVEGLMRELRNDENWNSINDAVRKEEKRLGYSLSEDDKARLITQMLTGYGDNQIRVGGTRFSKERTIDILQPKYAKYYKGSNESLLEYIRAMNSMIEGRKFLGRESQETSDIRSKLKRAKSKLVDVKATDPVDIKRKKLGQLFSIVENLNRQIESAPDLKEAEDIIEKADGLMEYLNKVKVMKPESVKTMVINQINKKIDSLVDNIETRNTNLENGIGQFVNFLVQNKIIPQNKVEEAVNIIQARMSPKGIDNLGVVILRDIGYITTLNDITNGITQLGDLFLSVYKNNMVNTLAGFGDVVSGKADVTREDLGIGEIISAEYDQLRNRDKANEFIIKNSLIKPFDSLGKATFINASWKRMQKLAKKENPRFVNELDRIFGDQSTKVLNDIKNGNLTYDAKYLIFAELSNIQPISLSEVPENYLKAGNLRIMYMLKTFAIKSLDIARNDAYNEIRKGNYKEGASNLFKLVVTFALMGAGTAALKDFIMGRAFELSDEVLDGVLQLVMYNRYMAFYGGKDGYVRSWMNSQLPPFSKLPDDFIKDVQSEEEIPKWKSIRNIPLVGEPYYWWFGGGVEKKKNKSKKTKKKVFF